MPKVEPSSIFLHVSLVIFLKYTSPFSLQTQDLGLALRHIKICQSTVKALLSIEEEKAVQQLQPGAAEQPQQHQETEAELAERLGSGKLSEILTCSTCFSRFTIAARFL